MAKVGTSSDSGSRSESSEIKKIIILKLVLEVRKRKKNILQKNHIFVPPHLILFCFFFIFVFPSIFVTLNKLNLVFKIKKITTMRVITA